MVNKRERGRVSCYFLYLVYFIGLSSLLAYRISLSTLFPLSYLFTYHISLLLSGYPPYLSYTIWISPLYWLSIRPICSVLFVYLPICPILSVYLPYLSYTIRLFTIYPFYRVRVPSGGTFSTYNTGRLLVVLLPTRRFRVLGGLPFYQKVR